MSGVSRQVVFDKPAKGVNRSTHGGRETSEPDRRRYCYAGSPQEAAASLRFLRTPVKQASPHLGQTDEPLAEKIPGRPASGRRVVLLSLAVTVAVFLASSAAPLRTVLFMTIALLAFAAALGGASQKLRNTGDEASSRKAEA